MHAQVCMRVYARFSLVSTVQGEKKNKVEINRTCVIYHLAPRLIHQTTHYVFVINYPHAQSTMQFGTKRYVIIMAVVNISDPYHPGRHIKSSS
jgi:hypothetical protein